ncbi:hypothetical protein [Flavobacterium columnare]|uniref:hypothetical protein n=1 Tax=Flavobacterium TaxID=237 RepID=UPI001F0BCF22|nr:hypothetical protein [Flavobacterium columnare]
MNPTDLLKLILPDFLVDYFEIISVYNSQESLHLYFEEKAKPPIEFDHTELVSKGLTVNYQSILNYFDNRSTNAAANLLMQKKPLGVSLER